MISRKLLKIRVLVIIILFFISICLSLNYVQNIAHRVDIDGLQTAAAPIYIDDSRSEYDRANAKSKGICTGEETLINPYIIQNEIIDGLGWENGIWIEKFNAYFILQNNLLTNCGQDHLSGGIKLNEVHNGLVRYNFCLNNTGVGIIIEDCSYIEVINNTLNYYEESGFRARWSSHVEIIANSLFGNDNN
jgi:parallel beta-helix repeat protein